MCSRDEGTCTARTKLCAWYPLRSHYIRIFSWGMSSKILRPLLLEIIYESLILEKQTRWSNRACIRISTLELYGKLGFFFNKLRIRKTLNGHFFDLFVCDLDLTTILLFTKEKMFPNIVFTFIYRQSYSDSSKHFKPGQFSSVCLIELSSVVHSFSFNFF